MKKIIILLCAIITAAAAQAATLYDYSLVITKKSGEAVTYMFRNQPVATFEGTDMAITETAVNGAKVLYPMTDIEKMTFSKAERSGVETVVSGENTAAFAIDATSITASGLKPEAGLTIFSLDGKKMADAKADADGAATIDISGLAPGAYIVATAGNSFKFIK